MKNPEVGHALTPSFLGLSTSLWVMAVVVAVVVLYWQDLNMAFSEALDAEPTAYILAVPFLLAYFLYRKRRMFAAAVQSEPSNRITYTKHLETLSGVLLCMASMLFYWHGS